MRRKVRLLNRQFILGRRRQTRRLRVLGQHPFVVPIVVFMVLVGISGGGLLWLSSRGESLKPAATDIVIISYDHQTQTVPSHEPTVGALISKLHIPINRGDVVEPAFSTPIKQDDFRINIYRAVPVKVVDGNNVTLAYNAATTPRSIAAQAGVMLYPEDGLTTRPVNNFLQEGAIGDVITVDRAAPITLNINGYAAQTRTLAKTVGEFLSQNHIVLGEGGSVRPAMSSLITANETIFVIRNGTGLESVTQTIPTPTHYVDDDSLAYGTFAVRQAGSPGQELLTYRTTVKNGQVVSSTLLQTVVTVPPVTEIIARGINLSGIKGDMARAGISPDDYAYADYIISRESGWCPTKIQGQYGGCPDNGGYVPPYGGYGLCQATPGAKMASAGADWATDPITQLEWCSGYAQSRYGGWYYAYLFWVNHHYW